MPPFYHMVTATFYSKTGFDGRNIPRQRSQLKTTFSCDLDIVVTYPVPQIRIPKSSQSYSAYQECDYCLLTAENQLSMFYACDMQPPEGMDVVTFNLTPDYVTTIGIQNMSFLHGMTSRRTVAKSEDKFGAFTQEDELMSCVQPLQIISGGWLDMGQRSSWTFVESTAGLIQMGQKDGELTAKNFITVDAKDLCTIPMVKSLNGVTTYNLDGKDIPSRGTRLFAYQSDVTGTNVQNGMDIARSIGAETAIISQYQVPDDYYTFDGATTGEELAVGKLSGVSFDKPTDLVYNWNDKVLNKRILYGSNCRYCIMSAAGNQAEFNPEEIYESEQAAPHVTVKTDPRPDGAPFFRYKNYLSDTQGFWTNFIAGQNWYNVPLVYTDKSGKAIDQYKYESNRAIEKLQYNQQKSKARRDTAASESLAELNANSTYYGENYGYGGSDRGMESWFGNDAFGRAMRWLLGKQGYNANQGAWAATAFKGKQAQEAAELDISFGTVAPEIVIPPSAAALRDFVGNTCYVWRYRPTDTDVARLDRILGMLGYKDAKMLEQADFNRRSNFSYVESSGVELAGSMPRWLREGAALQLSTGVRVWNITPSATAYLTNE